MKRLTLVGAFGLFFALACTGEVEMGGGEDAEETEETEETEEEADEEEADEEEEEEEEEEEGAEDDKPQRRRPAGNPDGRRERTPPNERRTRPR